MANHLLIDKNNNQYILDIALSYPFSTSNRISITESATGSGAVIYTNGIKVRTLPISGLLVSNSFAELDAKKVNLQKLADSGEIVEFITPYTPTTSNKYIISDISFEPKPGSKNWINFTCTLTEYREANVSTTQVNLVNFQSKQAFVDVYNNRIGNLK